MVSIIIVNWNSGPLLERCVRSILKNATGCQIIVVDNASHDSSLDFAAEVKAQITILPNGENLGLAAANNRGWRASKGTSILFLNPDTECLPGSVSRLEQTISEEKSVWAVGGQLLSPPGRPQIGFDVRSFPTIGSVAAEMLLLDKFWPTNPWTSRYRMSRSDRTFAMDVDQPAAACLMASRQALEAVGGFDENFRPAWFEDVDLCRRIWNKGGRIRFQPEARFMHHGGSSLAHLPREKFLEYFHSNQIRYFIKHHGARKASRVRALIISGLYLRSILSILYPLAKNASRVSSVRIFWNAARNIAGLPKVEA